MSQQICLVALIKVISNDFVIPIMETQEILHVGKFKDAEFKNACLQVKSVPFRQCEVIYKSSSIKLGGL